jgi:hypothetical protein
MRKVADHLLGRLTFEALYSRATNYFWNHRTASGGPGTGCSDQPRRDRKASSAERRTKTAFINLNLIARCSDARKSKHVTKLRAEMTVTHSLIASLLLSCENKSMQSSRQPCRFYSINRMEFPVHPALYWQRSRLGEINSRTLEYYHLNLSPSTRGRALMHH